MTARALLLLLVAWLRMVDALLLVLPNHHYPWMKKKKKMKPSSGATCSSIRRWSSSSSSSSSSLLLRGVSEWREKFSSYTIISSTQFPSQHATSSSNTKQSLPSSSENNNNNNNDNSSTNMTTNSNPPTIASTTSSDRPALLRPLLLLPFPPSQILLPGQSTTLQFKQGKYMDFIDESLTNYCGVIGCSILEDDGLLSTVVICEVMEEELNIKMGYRGFSSLEVGLRAVGRARRCRPNMLLGQEVVVVSTDNDSSLLFDDDGSSRSVDNDDSGGTTRDVLGKENDSNDPYEIKKTALQDIHIGLLEEYRDDDIISTKKEEEEDFNTALECIMDIKRLLMLIPVSTTSTEQSESGDKQQQCRQKMLYDKVYDAMLLHSNELEACSWASLAAASIGLNNVDNMQSSSSIIVRALETNDTLERLRLALSMLLHCILMRSNHDTVDQFLLFSNNETGTINQERYFQ